MKGSIKAALVSALVCPGFGHFIVKRYFRGLAILAVLFGALGYLWMLAMRKAKEITAQVDLETMTIELIMDFIADLDATIRASVTTTDTVSSGVAIFLIVVCWVFSIVDSYRLGAVPLPDKQEDTVETPTA